MLEVTKMNRIYHYGTQPDEPKDIDPIRHGLSLTASHAQKNVDRMNESIYAKEKTSTQHDVDNLIEQFYKLDLLQNISEEEKKEKRESLRALFEANSLWKDNYIDGIIKKIDDLDEYISEMQQQRALLYKEAEAKNQIEEIASEFYGLPKTYPEDFKETFPEVLHERANPIKQSMDEMDEIIEKIYSLDKDILNAEQKENFIKKLIQHLSKEM